MQSSTVQVNRDQDALASADEARSQHLVDMIRKALGFGSPEVKRGPGFRVRGTGGERSDQRQGAP